jgi:DNA-binding NarL/FixJ family response regulator
MLTVVLLGNSLALSGVGASLEARPGLRVVHVAAADAFAEALSELEPDVAVFDMAANQPDVVELWRRHPGVLPVGVDLLEHRAVVFSRHSSSVLTTDDLLRVIEGRKGPRSPKPRRREGVKR